MSDRQGGSETRGLSIELARANVGRRVEYMAGRLWAQAARDLGTAHAKLSRTEEGKIYSVNKRYVFVKFDDGSTKACVPSDLIFAPKPGDTIA